MYFVFIPFAKSGEAGRELKVPLIPPFLITKKHLYQKVRFFSRLLSPELEELMQTVRLGGGGPKEWSAG